MRCANPKCWIEFEDVHVVDAVEAELFDTDPSAEHAEGEHNSTSVDGQVALNFLQVEFVVVCWDEEEVGDH